MRRLVMTKEGSVRPLEPTDLTAVADLLIERDALLDLISDLAHTDRCEYDHHGYCQAHDWYIGGKECPHARAMKLFPPQISSHAKDGEQ